MNALGLKQFQLDASIASFQNSFIKGKAAGMVQECLCVHKRKLLNWKQGSQM